MPVFRTSKDSKTKERFVTQYRQDSARFLPCIPWRQVSDIACSAGSGNLARFFRALSHGNGHIAGGDVRAGD